MDDWLRHPMFVVDQGSAFATSIHPFPILTPIANDPFTGDSGNNTQGGTEGDDDFDYSQGGTDTLAGYGGSDTFVMGGALDSSDSIDGGDGNDVLSTSSLSIATSDTTFTNIETIRFVAGGSNYNIVTRDANIAAGQTLTFDATGLGTQDRATVQVFNETDGNVIFQGGAGDDFFFAGHSANTFMGGGGDDAVEFPLQGFDSNDVLDGGAGIDKLFLLNSLDVTFTATNFTNFEAIDLYESIHLVMNDANVAPGATLTVTLIPVTPSPNSLYFDGSAETDGRFVVYGGDSFDTLIGGAKDDLLQVRIGRDTAYGGGGDDTITLASQTNGAFAPTTGLDSHDVLDGGTGFDTVIFDVFAGGNVGTLLPPTLHSIEKLEAVGVSLSGPIDLDLTLKDANVDAGETLIVDASLLGIVGDPASLTLLSNQSDSFIDAIGSVGNDNLTGGRKSDSIDGGAGDDTLSGLGGADTLHGGTGNDVFLYAAVSESQGVAHDTVAGFDAAHDEFQTTLKVLGIDSTVTSGQLRAAHFEADLAAVLGVHRLKAHHAVLFTPDAGSDAGKTYLIVSNGTAGYQAAHDYVIELDSATDLASLGTANFTLSP